MEVPAVARIKRITITITTMTITKRQEGMPHRCNRYQPGFMDSFCLPNFINREQVGSASPPGSLPPLYWLPVHRDLYSPKRKCS
jgi:hypothetical protein